MPATYRIRVIRLVQDVQFFGICGKQISASMPGVHLAWDTNKVIVTCDQSPRKKIWLLPAQIGSIEFEEVEEG